MNKTTRGAIPVAVLLSTLTLTATISMPYLKALQPGDVAEVAVMHSNSVENEGASFDVAYLNGVHSVSLPGKTVVVQAPVENKVEETKPVLSRGGSPLKEKTADVFKVTAYDLSYESCGKYPSHKDYGKTATGYSLKGKDIRDRKIAVDPKVIPYGTEVYMEFPQEIRYIKTRDGKEVDLNGVYTAVDTGSAIRGKRIDLYVGEDLTGDFYKKLAYQIGVQKVKVYRLD